MLYDPLHEHLEVNFVLLDELYVVLGEPAIALQERGFDVWIKMLKCAAELCEIIVRSLARDIRRGELHLHEVHGVVGQEDAMYHLVVGNSD